MKRLLCFLAAYMLSAGCAKDPVAYRAPLVVEGWIGTGRAPVVMLTRGIAPSTETQSFDRLAETVVRYARVSIEHDGVEYPLFAKASDTYRTGMIFTTGKIQGEEGGQYTLKVEYEGEKATAVTAIPQRPVLGRVDSVPCPDSPDLFDVVAGIEDDCSEPRYYKFFYSLGDGRFNSAFMGNVSNEEKTGEFTTLHVHCRKGETVTVRLASAGKEIYGFWRSFDQNANYSTMTIISQYTNCPGNVDGALGYWAGYGFDEKTICVE